ncbi:MAG: HAD family hydrolase [Gammaproteobacteria bacterium]|nr:HAD family hydrolase [Gammaproteobacteria bacterium]MCW8923505.1 HAD family hydrolase [Gammaproteobacteria bacterium]
MNKNSAIKLLSFDLDDTLWPCRPTIMSAEQKLYDWMQQRVPEITSRFDIEALREHRMAFMQQRQDLAHDMSALRIESLKALAAELELESDWVQAAFDVFYQARQQVSLFDDVAPVLDTLQQDYRMIALTNGNASIEKTGVGHWFEFAVSAAEVGHQKPHPQFFETVLSRAELEASEILHIGDDPHRDIQGAFEAGIRSIWLNRTGQAWQSEEYQADRQIDTLNALPEILREMQAD